MEPVDTWPSGTMKANKQSNPLPLGAFQAKGIKGGNEELESEERGLVPRGWVLDSSGCRVGRARSGDGCWEWEVVRWEMPFPH